MYQNVQTVEKPNYHTEFVQIADITNENIYVLDQIKDKKNNDELWAENITIAEALKKLNPKEKMIIGKRFFDGRTQMEVAQEIGISQAQVSRIEKSAINHIKRIYK